MGRWKNVLTDRETFLATWHGDEEAARVASEQADAEREAEQRAASPRVYIATATCLVVAPRTSLRPH
jgi:hypothetical protein